MLPEQGRACLDAVGGERVRTYLAARTPLYAATAPELRGGEYIAPAGAGHHRGAPGLVRPPRPALDPDTSRRLWEASVRLTGVSFGPLDALKVF